MWSGGHPAGRPVPDNDITTLGLHLVSWNLPDDGAECGNILTCSSLSKIAV